MNILSEYSKYSETKKSVFQVEKKTRNFLNLCPRDFSSKKPELSTGKDLSDRKPIS